MFLWIIWDHYVLAMTVEELEMTVETSIIIWNSEFADEINMTSIQNDYVVQFLKNKKRKYCKDINRVILDYWIEYHNDGFQLNVESNDC